MRHPRRSRAAPVRPDQVGGGAGDRDRDRRPAGRRGLGAYPPGSRRRRHRGREPVRRRAGPAPARRQPPDQGDLLGGGLAAGRRRDAPGRRRGVRLQGGRARGGVPRDARGARRTRRAQPRRRRRHRDPPARGVEPGRDARDDDRRDQRPAPDDDHRQGRLPRQRVPRAPDAGHRRQGDRVRPEEPRDPQGRGGGVHRPARGLAREALDADRGDADRRGPGPRDALARALAGRPRAAASPGGRRERATVPRDHDRTRDQREPPRVGRPDAVHRDRPAAPGQRVSLLPRGPAGAAEGSSDGRGRGGLGDRSRRGDGAPHRVEGVRGAVLGGRGDPAQGTRGRRRRAAHGSAARGPARRDPVGRPAPVRRHPRVVRDPGARGRARGAARRTSASDPLDELHSLSES